MAKQVPIEIFNIARTKVDEDEVRRWLNFVGVSSEYELPDDGAVSNPALLIALAAKRCFDAETEILTDEGWKLFKDLSREEQVMTFNPATGNSEWQSPHGYFVDDYVGDMVVANGRDLSMHVTPDHRVYGRALKQLDSCNGFVVAQSLLSGGTFCVPLALGSWSGNVPDEIRLPAYEFSQRISNHTGEAYGTKTRTLTRIFSGVQVLAFAKLLTYFVAEGTVDHVGDDIRYLAIYGNHYEAVSVLCRELGLKCSQTIDPRNNCPKIRIGGGRQLARYVAQQCGKLSYEKHLPRWVLDLPAAELQAIWDILVATDGTVTEGGQELFQSTSKVLHDQAQEILVKLGVATSTSVVKAKDRPGAKIQSRRDSYYARRKSGRFAVINNWNTTAKAKLETYSGKIYCVSTRNGIICVRRNGKVFWSGNCYKSFEVSTSLNPNVTQIRKDWGAYLDNVMKVGHGSVLEHSVFTFAFENVSRVFTGEMNRHRAGWAISEGSMRFIRFSESVPYWEPDTIKGPNVIPQAGVSVFLGQEYPHLRDYISDGGAYKPRTLDEKKHATRLLFSRHFDNMRDWYRVLEEIWKEELAPESKFAQKKELTSLFRRGIGMGCATGGVWSGNVRALRHVLTMRCEPVAEEEILHVFSRVAFMMHKQEPLLFGDFHQDENGFWRPKYRKV